MQEHQKKLKEHLSKIRELEDIISKKGYVNKGDSKIHLQHKFKYTE